MVLVDEGTVLFNLYVEQMLHNSGHITVSVLLREIAGLRKELEDTKKLVAYGEACFDTLWNEMKESEVECYALRKEFV